MTPAGNLTRRPLIAASAAVALFGVGIAVPSTTSAIQADPRGDISSSCSVPSVPVGVKMIGKSRSDGVRYKSYKTKKNSPYSIVRYYKKAGKARGYRTTTWGGGATNLGAGAGSGWGVTMRKKNCGYVSIDAGAAKGKKTFFDVCKAQTSAITAKCEDYS